MKNSFSLLLLLIVNVFVFFPSQSYSATKQYYLVCSGQLYCIEGYDSPDKIEIKIRSLSGEPYQIALKPKAKNFKSDTSFRYVAMSKGKKLKTISFRKSKNWKFTFDFSSHIGTKTSLHNDNYVYSLPIQNGERVWIYQGLGDSGTHFSEETFAIDFALPVGSKILAAREGIVVGVKEDGFMGGPDRKNGSHNNYVWIEHDDGTIANYAHIKLNGSLVSIGDYIEKGQTIALSGNTGVSSAPHLHFHVSTPVRNKNFDAFKTFQVQFLTADEGETDKIYSGRTYTKPSNDNSSVAATSNN